MAKTRMVNTKFWGDEYVEVLKPLEKYLFLYFLTNPHTNICGIYELSIKRVRFETGLPVKKIEEIIAKLASAKKIYYIKGWVYVKNFQKHQTTSSKQVQDGIKAELGKVPEDIRKEIDHLDTLSDPSIYLNLDPDPDSDLDSPKGSDAQWNTNFFGVLKDSGIDFHITPDERRKYPRLFRRKYPDLQVIKSAITWARNLTDKKSGGYYWISRMSLPNLYYKIIPQYLENQKSKDARNIIFKMKAASGIVKTI